MPSTGNRTIRPSGNWEPAFEVRRVPSPRPYGSISPVPTSAEELPPRTARRTPRGLTGLRLHSVSWFVFLGVYGTAGVYRAMGGDSPGASVFAVWCGAALTLFAGIMRTLPVQNAVAIVGVAGGLGWLADRGMPGGLFSESLRIVVWITLTLGSRGAARWMLRRWRADSGYGWGVLGVGAAFSFSLLAGGALGSEPAVSEMGVTPYRYLIWMAAPAVIHMATTPWFLDKRPGTHASDAHPVGVLLLLEVWQWVLIRS